MYFQLNTEEAKDIGKETETEPRIQWNRYMESVCRKHWTWYMEDDL